MKTMRNNRKGQMSFDLGFAIVLVLLLFLMLTDYRNVSAASIENGRKLMALNAIADSIVGDLQAMYNSVVGMKGYAGTSVFQTPGAYSGNFTFTLELTDDYLYAAPGGSETQFDMVYEIDFGGGTDFQRLVTVRDPDSNLKVSKPLGFKLGATFLNGENAVGISCEGGPFSPGDKIKLTNCGDAVELAGGKGVYNALACESCEKVQ